MFRRLRIPTIASRLMSGMGVPSMRAERHVGIAEPATRSSHTHGRDAHATHVWRRRRWAALLLLPLMVMFGGCTSKAERLAEQAVTDYFIGQHDRAIARLRPLAEKTDQNFVLNNVRLGSAALARHDLDEAEAAFLRAYEVLNSFGVNSGGRTLGAVLVDEKIRVWRGEPFERAMVNFYLGLVYYMRQDYNNARAAFENALFKLRDYGTKEQVKESDYAEVDSNFALASIMLGRTFQRLGRDDLARGNFEYALKLRPELAALADYERHARSNLLLVVDFGYGPQKVTDFDGAVVGFAPTPMQEGAIPPPRVILDGQPIDVRDLAVPPVDMLALAQDRRWQSIDTVRAVKSALGTGLMIGGVGAGLHRESNAEVALALIAAGIFLKATSQADVRQWEMVPRTVFVIPLEVEPGTHDITVDFPHVHGLRQSWRGITVPPDGETTHYIRMQRWNTGPFDWPPPAMVRGATGEPAPAPGGAAQ